MIDWEKLAIYLYEVNRYGEMQAENVGMQAQIDQNVTATRKLLEEELGLDLSDEASMYALITGFSIGYRHPITKTQSECIHPVCFQAFIVHHSRAHQDIALVVRSIIKDLGVEVAVPDADSEG